MKAYRQKKIWLDENHRKYCIAKLYKEKIDMQNDYKERSPNDQNHYKCLGVHSPYEKLKVNKNGSMALSNETGTVNLCMQHCGAGVVSHEFLHAVLWAYKHKRRKKQYPIIIKDMAEEEDVLHNLTYAIQQFYKWYWKIEKYLK
jgi:hypothetical protein